MILSVRTPQDEHFNYSECEELFEQYHDILDVDSFDTVVKTTHFFAFYDWSTVTLLGCIYLYKQHDKVYVTGFATRGHHLVNIDALNMVLNWYKCDIYAENVQKAARICLLKCGFEKIDDNLYVYRRKING